MSMFKIKYGNGEVETVEAEGYGPPTSTLQGVVFADHAWLEFTGKDGLQLLRVRADDVQRIDLLTPAAVPVPT